ncbi:unnamed protein product, partial [Allacma fusca]
LPTAQLSTLAMDTDTLMVVTDTE